MLPQGRRRTSSENIDWKLRVNELLYLIKCQVSGNDLVRLLVCDEQLHGSEGGQGSLALLTRFNEDKLPINSNYVAT